MKYIPMILTTMILSIQVGLVGCVLDSQGTPPSVVDPPIITVPSAPSDTALVPSYPAHAKNIFRWKHQYVDYPQHGFPPSWRVKITLPTYHIGQEEPAKLRLSLGNSTTTKVLAPYDSGHQPRYTDDGKPQFELRSVMPEWASLMSGPITVTLRDRDGKVLLQCVKINPKANYAGKVQERME